MEEKLAVPASQNTYALSQGSPKTFLLPEAKDKMASPPNICTEDW